MKNEKIEERNKNCGILREINLKKRNAKKRRKIINNIGYVNENENQKVR